MIQKLNRTFAESRGWVIRDGVKFNGYKTFLPYYLMDAAYQVWLKLRNTYTFQHTDKQWANRMTEAFSRFFLSYRVMFSQEQQDYLLDLTDEFEEMIPHHVFIAEIAFCNIVSQFLELERQKPLAQMWIINMLAVIAQGWWGIVIPKSRKFHRSQTNPDIDAILGCSKQLASSYFETKGLLVEEKLIKNVEVSMNTLVNQIELWAKVKHQQNIDEEAQEAIITDKLQQLKAQYNHGTI